MEGAELGGSWGGRTSTCISNLLSLNKKATGVGDQGPRVALFQDVFCYILSKHEFSIVSFVNIRNWEGLGPAKIWGTPIVHRFWMNLYPYPQGPKGMATHGRWMSVASEGKGMERVESCC